jgi:hypothetical protein
MPDGPATYLLAIHVDSDARLRAGVAACLKCLGRRAGISTGPLCRLPDGATVADLLEARADVARLQGIIEGLCRRVGAQAELLSRRAEKGGS